MGKSPIRTRRFNQNKEVFIMANRKKPVKKLAKTIQNTIIKLYAAESLTLQTQAMVKVSIKGSLSKDFRYQIQNNIVVLTINKIHTDSGRKITNMDNLAIWFENLLEYESYQINEGDHIADLIRD